MTMVAAVPASASSRARSGLLALALFVACFWSFDLGVLGAGVPDPLDDTWEYGVAARHLLAGYGFRTRVIHPPLWSLLDEDHSVPVLIHGPLLPLIVEPAVATGGDTALDRVAWLAALFAFLAALLIYRHGTRLGDPSLGAVAALAFTLSPAVLRAVHHDLSLVLGACLLVLALELVFRERPRPVWAGLTLGVSALVRPEFLLAVPMLALASRRRPGRLVLAALIAVAPWAWHNFRATGLPFFNLSSYLTLGYWGRHPDLTVLRDFELTPARWPAALAQALPTLPAKWLDFLPHALKRALLLPTAATGWLAVVGGGAAFVNRTTRRWALTAFGLALIPLFVMTVTLYDPRYVVPFLPLWAIAAAWGLRTLVRRLPEWAHTPRLEIGLVTLLLLPSIAPAMAESAREARELHGRLRRDRDALHALAAGDHDRLMFSDTPDFVSWTTGRPVVWLTRAEYRALPSEPDHGRT